MIWATLTQMCNEPITIMFEFLVEIQCLLFYVCCVVFYGYGNLHSSIGKSARLVIWRFEVRIPVQVQIFLLKSKLYFIVLMGWSLLPNALPPF